MEIQLFKSTGRWIFLIGLISMLLSTACFVIDPEAWDDEDWHDRKVAVSESFDLTSLVDGHTRFEIDGISGSIEITGSPDATSVHVWGERIVESDTESDARASLAYLEVNIASDDQKIRVWTNQPSQSNGRNYKVIYHVELPEALMVHVENINGNVSFDHMQSSCIVDLINGNINLRDHAGSSDVDLINGIVHINAQGSSRVNVTNGLITGNVTLPLDGECLWRLTNGNIVLSIPTLTSALFYAGVTNGEVSVSDLTLTNITSTKKAVSGTLGNGRGNIDVRAVNGNVTVQGF